MSHKLCWYWVIGSFELVSRKPQRLNVNRWRIMIKDRFRSLLHHFLNWIICASHFFVPLLIFVFFVTPFLIIYPSCCSIMRVITCKARIHKVHWVCRILLIFSHLRLLGFILQNGNHTLINFVLILFLNHLSEIWVHLVWVLTRESYFLP